MDDLTNVRTVVVDYLAGPGPDTLEVYSSIAQELPFAFLVSTSRSSRIYEEVVADLVKTRLEEKLAEVVPNVARLFAVLEKTRSVIGGEWALNFILAQGPVVPTWSPSCIDIYCEVRNCPTVVEYLTREAGYIPAENTVAAAVPLVLPPLIACAFHLFHTERNVYANVLCAEGDAAEAAVISSWGTHLMNFVSPFDIVVAYPELTLKNKAALNHANTAGLGSTSIEVYQGRGFDVRPFNRLFVDHTSAAGMALYCPHVRRAFDDAACARLRFASIEDEYKFGGFWDMTVEWTLGGLENTCGGHCGKVSEPKVRIAWRV